MNIDPVGPTDLFTPAEVAALLYVDPKTVTRWAIAGKIRSIRTPGGHRRFLRSDIIALTVVDEGTDAGRHPTPNPAHVSHPGFGPSAPADTGDLDRRAAVLVAEAVTRAIDAQAGHVADDVAGAAAAVHAAAERATDAAQRSRDGRARAAQEAAGAIAGEAVRTAADVKLRTDASVRKLSDAAADAAALVVAARRPGHDRESAATALQLASSVQAAAMAVAQDRAEAAAQVASAVTAAAATVAFRVSALDIAIEIEVARVAAALQATATAHARQVAADVDARASATAAVAQEAAVAIRYRNTAAPSRDLPEVVAVGSASTPGRTVTGAQLHAELPSRIPAGPRKDPVMRR